jgi:hypothetical protein
MPYPSRSAVARLAHARRTAVRTRFSAPSFVSVCHTETVHSNLLPLLITIEKQWDLHEEAHFARVWRDTLGKQQ